MPVLGLATAMGRRMASAPVTTSGRTNAGNGHVAKTGGGATAGIKAVS